MKTLAVLLSFTFAVAAQAVVFFDPTFNLANYSETAVFTSSALDVVTFDQCPTCGNPGTALRIQIASPGTSDAVAIGVISNTFLYNPQTQGVISSIDASVDKNLASPQSPIIGNTFRPLILQDGVIYLGQFPARLAASAPDMCH